MRELSIVEFASRKKSHPNTIRGWIKRGIIKGEKNKEGVYRISEKELKVDIYEKSLEVRLKNKKH